MEPEKLLEALHTAEKLKDTTRHCYTSRDGTRAWPSTAGALR